MARKKISVDLDQGENGKWVVVMEATDQEPLSFEFETLEEAHAALNRAVNVAFKLQAAGELEDLRALMAEAN